MNILLTNDDGYDSVGLHALADSLEEVADVTIVAPAEDNSAIGRKSSSEVTVEERDRGYHLTGTPVDCVIVGIDALGLEPDVVVAGCNAGANFGGHALGRSGTVSAAVEATFFDLPSVASSLYVPQSAWPFDGDAAVFREAVLGTRFLVEHVVGAGVLSPGEYLNVNAPFPGERPAELRLTRPTSAYGIRATWEDGVVRIEDPTWEALANGEIDEPADTDRGAVVRGDISVTPLVAPHQTIPSERFDALVREYQPASQ